MIKTRFAPSPTGDLHIGGLRTALYNYLFTKKNNGKFLLRIEDTDQARYQEGSIERIIQALEWAGLEWDNKKNNKRQKTKDKQIPNSKFQILNSNLFLQSKRIDIYKKYAEQLVKQGNAYYCFCSQQTLSKMRKEQMNRGEPAMYDRRCKKLSSAEVQKKIKQGVPHTIRLKIPDIHTGFSQVGWINPPKGGMKEGVIKFHDIIRGDVEFDLKTLDDQVLIKSDGYPTYHLANVVDDYEMKITHVIRAEEWLPSTPKHIILYSALSWQVPEFAHIPLVLAPDKSKLSKRHGAVSVLDFKKLGYLPEALLNYLALLGWNPGDEREIFSLKELIKEFDLKKVHSAGAVFDINKLDWMNGHYIRGLDAEKLTVLCLPYLQDAKLVTETLKHLNTKTQNYIKKVVVLEQERMKKLSEITELTDYFFKQPEYNSKLLKWKKGNLKDAKEKLEFLAKHLKQIPENNWTKKTLEKLIKDLIKNNNLNTGDVLWPMRVGLTGREKSPGPFEVAEVLGKEETIKRLKIAVKKL